MSRSNGKEPEIEKALREMATRETLTGQITQAAAEAEHTYTKDKWNISHSQIR